MLENVEEFKTWGPLNRRHRPIKSKQGQTFNKFISQLEGLGYVVEHRELATHDMEQFNKDMQELVEKYEGQPDIQGLAIWFMARVQGLHDEYMRSEHEKRG